MRWRYRSLKLFLLASYSTLHAIWVGRIDDQHNSNPLEFLQEDTISAESPDICRAGFINDPGGHRCVDVDECNSPQLNNCTISARQTCVNNQGGYECECQTGYLKAVESASCTDIDECSQPVLGRGARSVPVLRLSSSSSDISSSSSDSSICPANTECVNTDGSFICECSQGYRQEHSTQVERACIDIDECHFNTHNCPKNARCINSHGSFRCVCKHGYAKTTKTGSCEDIDECVTRNACQGLGEICHNTDPGFYCSCQNGYIRLYNRYCIDINECLEEPDLCTENSSCRNWYGGYSCICNTGYEKVESGQCVPSNQCSSHGHKCRHKCRNNVTTKKYECYCPDGYRSSGYSCSDINECDWRMNTCEQGQSCINLYGGFKCLEEPKCPDGYDLVPGYRDFANFYHDRRSRRRMSRTAFAHVCSLIVRAKGWGTYNGQSDAYYYDDYTDKDAVPEEPAVNAIYWSYITLRKKVRPNTKILRLDFNHRRQSSRGVRYIFTFPNTNATKQFKIVHRGRRRPRAMVRVHPDAAMIKGPQTRYLTIKMRAENSERDVLDTLLVKAVIFVSEFNF